MTGAEPWNACALNTTLAPWTGLPSRSRIVSTQNASFLLFGTQFKTLLDAKFTVFVSAGEEVLLPPSQRTGWSG